MRGVGIFVMKCHGGEGVKKWSNMRYLINEQPLTCEKKLFFFPFLGSKSLCLPVGPVRALRLARRHQAFRQSQNRAKDLAPGQSKSHPIRPETCLHPRIFKWSGIRFDKKVWGNSSAADLHRRWWSRPQRIKGSTERIKGSTTQIKGSNAQIKGSVSDMKTSNLSKI